MILSTLLTPLLLLPYASSASTGGVHKMKLKKAPVTAASLTPEFEGAYLAQKYGAQQQPLNKMPPLRFARPDSNDNLYRTQEDLNGGHNVPLASMY
jgi:saccharopepsin